MLPLLCPRPRLRSTAGTNCRLNLGVALAKSAGRGGFTERGDGRRCCKARTLWVKTSQDRGPIRARAATAWSRPGPPYLPRAAWPIRSLAPARRNRSLCAARALRSLSGLLAGGTREAQVRKHPCARTVAGRRKTLSSKRHVVPRQADQHSSWPSARPSTALMTLWYSRRRPWRIFYLVCGRPWQPTQT